MKFNFRKILSVAASAVMLGSTFGIAAAATYPAPFVVSGTADGAVVVGANSANTDWAAAIDLSQDLNGLVTTSTGTDDTVTGEGYPLFTSSSKIYYNETIDQVRSSLTDTELPVILADGIFDGDESADYTQTITLFGSKANRKGVKYAKQPDSDDEPKIGVDLGSSQQYQIYNLTVTFDKGVNFSHADSETENINLFGRRYTVATETSNTKGIVMYRSSETVDMTLGGSDPNPTATITVGGEEYLITLVSGSDTDATVKVTDSSGASDSKEISEGQSKKVQGLEVAVNRVDESTATDTITAEITAGAEKIILKNGQTVKKGSDETSVRGTVVTLSAASAASDQTSITISAWEDDGDEDAIVPGQAWVDPIFETFKIDFAGLNLPTDSTTARETISVAGSSNSVATLTMTNHQDSEATIEWYYNKSVQARLADSGGDVINVIEEAEVNESEYVVIGNEDEGYLLEMTTIENGSESTGMDTDIVFTNVFDTSETFTATIDVINSAYIYIGGKKYTIDYSDADSKSSDEYVRINYPDSTTDANTAVLYPSIETGMGAKAIFYEPQIINLTAWDKQRNTAYQTISISGASPSNLSTIRFADGDGYTDATITFGTKARNYSIDAGVTNISSSQGSDELTVGELKYNFTGTSKYPYAKIYLIDPSDGGNVNNPAIILLEEKTQSANAGADEKYHAVLIEMASGKAGDSNKPVGVGDIKFSYNSGDCGGNTGCDLGADFLQHEADDDLYTYMDLWGVLATIDESDTDSYTTTISYPDEQIYAKIYVAEEAANIEIGQVVASSGAGGTVVVVKDSEASSVSGKNLIVVGGSCVNTLAAKILGSDSPVCGEAFTDLTSVGAGQYLIKTVASPLNDAKVATLVAGYDAEDTTDAAAKIQEGVATDVDTETVYPIASA